jgi:hypothetical protein
MPFQRSDFYGLDFAWFAVDETGAIAQFTTGFGPMPRQLFLDQTTYEAAADYLSRLESSCISSLTKAAMETQEQGQADYSLFREDAARGLYAYGEGHYGPSHNLYAIPGAPLRLDALPNMVSRFLTQFRVGIRFADHETIDVTQHFECG